MLGNHPEIESALKTGYPTWNQPKIVYCDLCGDDITDEDHYEDEDFECICKSCLLSRHKKGW